MSDVKCPMCLGELVREFNDGSMWWCRACGYEPLRSDASGEDFKTHAYFEPRNRLPTPEEEAAHTAKHGAEAGWMASQGMGWHSIDDAAEMRILRGFVGESWRCYPIVNARPVAWPDPPKETP